ncbi:MAG: endopeptidase La, partial [Deltaproteobacteria bacterium]|nr:endopeptidase La [Deltaproteobacteria bacterium]
PFFEEKSGRRNFVGVATGMAWTPVGGTILFIEASRSPGNRGLLLTGQLGDVMRESGLAALSYLRAHARDFGISDEEFSKYDIHVHVPAGGMPKDGPSAGIALFTALASLFTGRPVRRDTSMTGELTLRGQVLPIGGLKQKVLGAHRAGIKIVYMPERNRKDALDVPPEVTKDLEIRYMTKVDDVLDIVLGPAPERPAAPTPAMPPPAAGGGRVPAESLPS